jgi:hypothetical protein
MRGSDDLSGHKRHLIRVEGDADRHATWLEVGLGENAAVSFDGNDYIWLSPIPHGESSAETR